MGHANLGMCSSYRLSDLVYGAPIQLCMFSCAVREEIMMSTSLPGLLVWLSFSSFFFFSFGSATSMFMREENFWIVTYYSNTTITITITISTALIYLWVCSSFVGKVDWEYSMHAKNSSPITSRMVILTFSVNRFQRVKMCNIRFYIHWLDLIYKYFY